MKRTLFNTLLLTACSFGAFSQVVNIPDANFKAYLVGNTAINTNNDSEIQVSEAAAFNGSIFANNLGITDLTGIEAFTSLDGLYCRDNNIGSLDISSNTALTYVDCQNTSISSLDVSNNTALTGLTCSINNLTSLDVSNNTALTAINCSNNDLTSLDVSNNTLLSNFSCDNNNLTSLDVTNNTALLYFVCYFNNIASLDLSNCTALAHFSCTANNLSSLDVSNNLSLGALYCSMNNLTVLDVSANTSLQVLRCDVNDLTALKVNNGNNLNFTTFIAYSNPNLTCIQVDDAAYSTANWMDIDATASFSEDCGYTIGVEEEELSQLSVYPNPATSTITIEGIDGNVEYQIVNALGTVVQVGVTSNGNSIQIESLKTGVYFLKAKGSTTSRFIKK